MDQLPRGNEGFPNSNMFGDSQQYNAYDNLFHTGADQNSYDASWGVNASNYPVQSRGAHHAPAQGWPQSANHLSAPPAHAGVNGQASPYARSLSHSPAPYGQNAFTGFGAPQNFQYRQPQFDPSMVPPHALNQGFNYSTTNYETPNTGTIAPHALQHEPRASNFAPNRYDGSPYQASNFAQPRPNTSFTPELVDQAKLIAAIPPGKNGGRFSIINFDELAKATNSERMGNFLNVGTEAHNWDVNRAALPNYVPRKSRSELRKLAGNDPKLLGKLGKKTLKKEKPLIMAPKPLQGATKALSPVTEKIKQEQDSSSDESSSDAEDESSYTSEDEGESPLPAKRPDRPKEGTEYDTIKALWRGKRKNLDSASIRNGLGEFWEITKTIRDRWKADVAAVQDAESKNRTNELPLLESRVKDQRDMLETAFKAALKHGHRGILELMSENVSLLYLCYQFLLDRVKAEDYNSPLPRVMLETISLFKTLTNDKLEKTHMVKVLPRFIKKGDAKTQYYAKRITANATAASEERSGDAPAKKTATKETTAASPPSKRTDPEPVAGIKRSASTAADGGASKKLATGVTKTNGVSTATKPISTLKKPTPASESTKGAAATTGTAAKPKQVVAKPSGLFSSLQSAAKKPGTSTINKGAQSAALTSASKPVEKSSTTAAATNQNAAPVSTFSFAETMANLSKPKEEKPVVKQEKQTPLETAEEKAKRLRKESRRHLHVSFKPKEELVTIHEFYHDPEEELGHDANQVRDLADVGGEGRMFKQQNQMMDIDDDEETAEEDEKMLEFFSPSAIDFSVIDPEQRKQNCAPFGGGQTEPESEERSIRERYEADTLIVFYADSNDIPPNPREPSDSYSGPVVDAAKKLGSPEEKYAIRARQRKFGSPQQHKLGQSMSQSTPALGFDLSKLASYGNNPQIAQPTSYQTSTQPAAPTNEAISNILASLQQAQANQSTPPQPTIGTYTPAYSAPAPNPTTFPTQQQPAQPPSGQPDLAAILAQIQQTQPAAPSMTAFNYNAPAAMSSMTSYPQQMQQQAAAAPYENPERKQWREGNNNNSNADPAMKLRRQNPAQNPYYRTKVCKYWQEGRCQKGEQCSYRHSES